MNSAAMNGPIMNGPAMNGPAMNGSGANGPLVTGPLVTGPIVTSTVRIGREYTGKHRREGGPGPISPWNGAEPEARPRPGTRPAVWPDVEGGPWADAG